MTTESQQTPVLGPNRALGAQIGLAALIGTAVAVLFVLPAEYGVDLTGFGAATGLNRISQPAEVVVETKTEAPPEIAAVSAVPFRSDTVQIRVGGLAENFGAVEYKVTLAEGQTMVYSWEASEELIYEFHGHTLPTEEEPQMLVMDYIKGKGASAHGTLTAPIDGIHGWYFANAGMEPVMVDLKLSGYYTLEPGVMEMTR